MFKLRHFYTRVFLCSLSITLSAVITVSGFVTIYRNMLDDGIPTSIPMIVQFDNEAIIIETGDTINTISTELLTKAENLRRGFDPLTLPRPVRLIIKLYALITSDNSAN